MVRLKEPAEHAAQGVEGELEEVPALHTWQLEALPGLNEPISQVAHVAALLLLTVPTGQSGQLALRVALLYEPAAHG